MPALQPRSLFMASTLATLAAPAAADAAYQQYFSGNSIGPGHLNSWMLHRTSAPGFRPGALGWDEAVGVDVTMATADRSGQPTGDDFCTYYNTGTTLNTPFAADTTAATGMSPGSSYQVGDGTSTSANNYCQASGTSWGFLNSGLPTTNQGCISGPDDPATPQWDPLVSTFPCGMQHFASNAYRGGQDRPWSPSFGSFPSFKVDVTAEIKRMTNPNGGAWGYVCPLFRDMSTSSQILEFCLAEWSINGGFISKPLGRDYPTCASGSGFNIDQFLTQFGDPNSLATLRHPSAVTATAVGGGERRYVATISRTQMYEVIALLNSPTLYGGCGRSVSTNPSDWAYIGVENGQEGGALGAPGSVGSHARGLVVATTTDAVFNADYFYAGQAAQTITSPNGLYSATLQGDGNFVVTGPGGPRSISNTFAYTSGTGKNAVNHNPGATATLSQGDFIVYDSKNTVLWHTGTSSGPDAYLEMRDDGVLAIYNGNTLLWSA